MNGDATILDGNPAALDVGSVAGDNPAEKCRAARAPKPAQLISQVGGDDAFILAWGRSHAALGATRLQLAASVLVNLALAVVVAFLAWRSEHKEPLVFVRDSLGNVVQADATSFLHAGDDRNDAEVKGFLRRWVLDAWTWTPLDVEDRLKACLRVVDGKAQAVTKAGLRLAERQALVDREMSGRVYDDEASGREPQVAITRRDPLEVMVSFDHYYIDRTGRATEGGHYFVRAILKQVPRSPVNPSGLMIADVQISQNL
jgi:hypothetical protein